MVTHTRIHTWHVSHRYLVSHSTQFRRVYYNNIILSVCTHTHFVIVYYCVACIGYLYGVLLGWMPFFFFLFCYYYLYLLSFSISSLPLTSLNGTNCISLSPSNHSSFRRRRPFARVPILSSPRTTMEFNIPYSGIWHTPRTSSCTPNSCVTLRFWREQFFVLKIS